MGSTQGLQLPRSLNSNYENEPEYFFFFKTNMGIDEHRSASNAFITCYRIRHYLEFESDKENILIHVPAKDCFIGLCSFP